MVSSSYVICFRTRGQARVCQWRSRAARSESSGDIVRFLKLLQFSGEKRAAEAESVAFLYDFRRITPFLVPLVVY